MPASVTGAGDSCLALEDEAANDRPEDPNLGVILGSALTLPQPPALIPFGKIVFRLYSAGSLASASDATAPVISDEDQTADSASESAPQIAFSSAGTSDDGAAALDRDPSPEQDAHLRGAAAAVVSLPDSTPSHEPCAFGLQAGAAAVSSTTGDDGSHVHASATQLDSPQLASPPVSEAPGSSEPATISHGARPQSKASYLVAPGHRFHAALDPLAVELPDTDASALADLHVEKAADGDTSATLAFEGMLSQKTAPAPQGAIHAASATPSKPEDSSGRAGLSVKPAVRNSDSRSVRPAPETKPITSFVASSASNPDEVQEAGQQRPLARTGAPEGHSALASTPAGGGEGSTDGRLSYEAPASQQGETAAESADASRSTEPAASTQFPHEPDADPSGRVGDAVREVSLKVENPDGAAVHFRFTERRGEVHLTTRTQDPVLSGKLAGGLPELRKAIEDAGMSADIWAPGQESTSHLESAPPRSDSGAHPGNSSGPWQRQGDPGGRRQGGQPDRWADQIEDALDGGQGGRK